MTQLTPEQRSERSRKAAATRKANRIAAGKPKKQESKQKTSFIKNWRKWLPWILLALGLLALLLFWHPWTTICTKCGETNKSPLVNPVAAEPTALWTPATCASLSTKMGIPLTVLTEGDGFTACVYTGPIIKINIPHFTVVDVDRGQVEVWINSDVDPTTVESGNMTFRQWNGKLGSACSQVLSLDEYLQTLNENLHAVPGNFDCSNQ